MLSPYGFERDRWKQHARAYMRQSKLTQFYPVAMYEFNEPEWDLVFVRFNCHWLGVDGRCRNYDKRPGICRDYEPGYDRLCIENETYRPSLKGIPIVRIQ